MYRAGADARKRQPHEKAALRPVSIITSDEVVVGATRRQSHDRDRMKRLIITLVRGETKQRYSSKGRRLTLS